MRRFIKIIGIFIISSINVVAFNISSSSFDKRIDGVEPGYKEYTIKNETTQTSRYRVIIGKPVKAGAKDMSKYITVRPKVIAIPPYSERKFRVYAHTKEKLPKEQYTFSMRVAPIVLPALQKKVEGNKITGGMGLPINLVLDMNGYTGEITPELVRDNIKFQNVKLIEERDPKTKKKEYFVTGNVKSTLYASRKIIFKELAKLGEVEVGKSYLGVVGENSERDFKIKVKEKINKLSVTYLDDNENYVEFTKIDL